MESSETLLAQIVRQQQGSRGNCGEDISRQLRPGDGEKKQEHSNPNQKKQVEGIGIPASDFPKCKKQCNTNEGNPRNPAEQCDGKVIPEGFGMMEQVCPEAGEIVLEKEHAEELRIPELHEDVPGTRNC